MGERVLEKQISSSTSIDFSSKNHRHPTSSAPHPPYLPQPPILLISLTPLTSLGDCDRGGEKTEPTFGNVFDSLYVGYGGSPPLPTPV